MKRWVVAGGGIALLVLAGVSVGTQVSSSPIAWNCTVGFAGTDLNISVSGWGAGSACQQMISEAPKLMSSTQAPSSSGQLGLGQGYLASTSGTLMCSYQLNGLGFTVRDAGLLKAFGTAACQYLQQQTPEAKAAAAKQAAAQRAAEAAAQKAMAEQAAQQAAQAAAQQLADEQSAVDHDASQVESDLTQLAEDANTASAGPSSLSDDLQQAQHDLTQAGGDLQKVQAEGSGSLDCSADANTVEADANTVLADQNTIEADQNTQQAADQSASTDIQALQSDFSKLRSDEAAVPSYTPSGLPTQDAVNQAVKSAQGSVSHGDRGVSTALAEAQGLVNQANQDASKAQAVCG